MCCCLCIQVAYVLGQMEHPASVPALADVLRDTSEHRMVRHEVSTCAFSFNYLQVDFLVHSLRAILHSLVSFTGCHHALYATVAVALRITVIVPVAAVIAVAARNCGCYENAYNLALYTSLHTQHVYCIDGQLSAIFITACTIYSLLYTGSRSSRSSRRQRSRAVVSKLCWRCSCSSKREL
jgi:hypothetical protein